MANQFSALTAKRSLAAGVAYGIAAVAFFSALSRTIGTMPTLLAALSLIVGATLPGAAVVALLLRRASLFHLATLGTTAGLGLWSLGGLLSHLTDVYWVRWIPSVAALAIWLIRTRQHRVKRVRSLRVFPALPAVGALAGLITLAPAVRSIISTQPSSWSGWYSLYPDLGFHVALASEVAARSPEGLPWVAGTPLSYTWMFHSAMGVWSSLSGITPADIVLQVWPVLFAVLIPAVIAIVAWDLSRSSVVAALAPLMFTLAHGLILAPASSLMQVPIQPLSPTRDYGDLFLLLAFMCLKRVFGRSSRRALSGKWLAALFLVMVIATGSKGSELPILLGGVLSALAILIIRSRASLADVIASITFAIAGALGYFLAIPDSGSVQSLSWGPLTFLSEGTPHREVFSLVLVLLLLLAIVSFWILLGTSAGWVLSTLMAGTMLAGLIGLTFLTQSGSSQLYFWQGVEPLIAIALAWTALIVVKKYGAALVVCVASIFVGVQILGTVTQSPLFLGLGIIAFAAASALVLELRRFGIAKLPWRSRIGQGLVLALLLTQSAQIIGLPAAPIGSAPSTADDSSAVEGSQLVAFNFIREHSTSDELVATNQHCRAGSLANDDCDPREFLVSALTQRQVLVEGWGYTQNGASTKWVKSRLQLSDGFIESPTVWERHQLAKKGVRFIYIDTRLPFSANLGTYAHLVFSSEWARVYRIS